MNSRWEELCKIASLQKGWHLARADTYQDFLDEPFYRETFAYFVKSNIDELLRLLISGDYRPRPLTRVAIPKGALATRPGTLLSLEDRVILFSALRIIAEEVDAKLIPEVYSYRVKKGNKSHLFHEGDAISLPFLKHKTVQRYIDPFDPWYGLWPKFDALSRKAFEDDGYMFMATSDIAAYFENIQLDILRDQLQDLLPSEQKIVNLFITAFSSWTYDTNQGRRFNRGIPQGTQISSFFGNIFLMPMDNAFKKLKSSKDVRYYRYMDDIRIFTKSFEDARAAVLLLDSEIRRLHLNLQSAKTKIYDENAGEISDALIDRRLAQIENVAHLIYEIQKNAKREKAEPDYSGVLERLDRIANEHPSENSGEHKIMHARKALSGLSDRVFRRLLTLYLSIGSDKMFERLVLEVKRNPDHRLGKKLIQYGKKFPRKSKAQTLLVGYLTSEERAFPYQESQILQALRYQSRIKSETFEYSMKRASDTTVENSVRAQALYLISRCGISGSDISSARRIFDETESTALKKAAALVLMRQRGQESANFTKEMVFHPNEGLSKMGMLMQSAKNDVGTAQNLTGHAISEKATLVDYLPFLYLMIESRQENIVELVVRVIRRHQIQKVHQIMDVRDRCKQILKFADQNLTALRSRPT